MTKSNWWKGADIAIQLGLRMGSHEWVNFIRQYVLYRNMDKTND